MEDFLSIKAIKEISREKIERFNYISATFQGGHRWAGRNFSLNTPHAYPQKDYKFLIFYSQGYKNAAEMK